MADPVFLAALKQELVNDPVGIGYTAPNAGVEADAIIDGDLINTVNRLVDVQTLSASELFEAIDQGDWSARTADQKDDIRLVLGLGDNIKIAPGTKARDILANALSGASASLANLGVIGTKTVSRAEELGFSRVTYGDIQNARLLP